MYTRLNNTITNAINDVMNNSVCDFDNWWKDDFETEISSPFNRTRNMI